MRPAQETCEYYSRLLQRGKGAKAELPRVHSCQWKNWFLNVVYQIPEKILIPGAALP